ENGVIELYFVNTEYQLANLFTKALGRDIIDFLTNKLGMRSFTPETLKQLMNAEDELSNVKISSLMYMYFFVDQMPLPINTIATTIEQQVVLDETLVPSTQRLRIGRMMADVPEIYMQEFWATARLHQHSILFKMDTRKSVLDLEAFREMLHISPRIPSQSFANLPFEEEILEFLRNSMAYKEYYACATGEAVPKPKASARKKKGGSASSTPPPTPIATPTPTTTVVAAPRLSAAAKGKQPARATTPTEPTDVERTEAEPLKILLKRSRQETHISQQRGSELAKNDDEDTESGKGGDEVSESEGESYEEETRQEEEESFDPIPRTLEGSEDKGNDEEDQDLSLSKEARIQEEEEADELYRDVDINQGRGLQVTQNIEDSHVTLTLVHPDGLQESSSVSSFVTSMLNLISDAGVESILTTASSPIVSLQTPTPIMTPSTIATITTSSDASIPPTTIPSTILENLPTFNSVFRFDERLRSLETTFSEYRQTNPFIDAVSAIPENDEFLLNIDENMKKIIKGQVKSQVKEQVSCILPIIEESVNATLEAEVLTKSSHSSRTSYALTADLSEMELKKIPIEKMEGNNEDERMMIRKDPPLDRTGGLKDEEKEGSMHQLALHLKQLPGVQAYLPQGLNLDNCLPVKSQVKEQGSRILPRIKESVNATLEAEVLTRSSHSSRTSYAIVADLSEMELKKIRIEKMEGNKSIQHLDEQRNLYKALVKAYDADKTILDTYGESTILKRRRKDDDQEEPSAGSDRGSKRQREGGEHASASTPSETATGSIGRSTTGSQSRQLSASESAFAEEPVQTTCQMEEPSHPVFETGADDQPIVQTSQHPEWFSMPRRPPSPDRDWNKTLPVAQGDAQSWISELARQTDARSSFNELLDTPIDFSNFIMNRLDVATLSPELLAGPTYELMRGSCNSLTELEYHLE
nr:ribonuclease H [Tanacetum cinerariifolium]